MTFFIIFEDWYTVNVHTESIKQNKLGNIFFVGILEVTDERIRIRIRKSSVRIQGSMYDTRETPLKNVNEPSRHVIFLLLLGHQWQLWNPGGSDDHCACRHGHPEDRRRTLQQGILEVRKK